MHHKAPFFIYTKYMYRFFPIHDDGKEKRRKELVTVHHGFIQEVCEGICISLFLKFCVIFESISLKINDFFWKKIKKLPKLNKKKSKKKKIYKIGSSSE